MLTLDWQQELFKALLNVIVAAITLSLGWFVGQRLTVYWAIRQKHRELELAAVNEFYKLYGEFFAVWKLWAYYLDSIGSGEKPESSDTTRWELLKRATAAEGALESVFVKLSSEKRLANEDIEVLGKFRQAYQQLRESIRDHADLGWSYQTHPEYLTFKRLAHLTARLILSDIQPGLRAKDQATDALENITASAWEKNWIITDDDWARLRIQSRMAAQ